MNKHHQEILDQIVKVASINPPRKSKFDINRYMGTNHHIYHISTPQTWQILKKWARDHKDISSDDLLEMLNSIFKGESHNERSLGGKLLQYFPQHKVGIKPEVLDLWLKGAEGWGEVDSLCQSTFTAKELLNNWSKWEKLINKFLIDKDIHKRRASLVLLVKPVRESSDPRLADLAFKNIDRLKREKDILITKAISWLLRDLIKHHKERVQSYLDTNSSILPKIVIREVGRKLLTGRKN